MNTAIAIVNVGVATLMIGLSVPLVTGNVKPNSLYVSVSQRHLILKRIGLRSINMEGGF